MESGLIEKTPNAFLKCFNGYKGAAPRQAQGLGWLFAEEFSVYMAARFGSIRFQARAALSILPIQNSWLRQKNPDFVNLINGIWVFREIDGVKEPLNFRKNEQSFI
jgi:hypothetical protein